MYQSFHLRVYGMKLVLLEEKQTILIDGVVDDLITYKYENPYIMDKILAFKDNVLNDANDNYEGNEFLNNFCDSLTIKELLVYSIEELTTKYLRSLAQVRSLIKKLFLMW